MLSVACRVIVSGAGWFMAPFHEGLWTLNTLRMRQDSRHFPNDILKYISLNENVWISLTISPKCVQKVRINNIPSLVQIMAWRRPGDKPISEPMMVSLLMHICVTRPQWVNQNSVDDYCKRRMIIRLDHKNTLETCHDITTQAECQCVVWLNKSTNYYSKDIFHNISYMSTRTIYTIQEFSCYLMSIGKYKHLIPFGHLCNKDDLNSYLCHYTLFS